MKKLERKTSVNKDFVSLVKELDAFLSITDGDEHDFYDQYNKLENIKHVVLIFENKEAVACGAFKHIDKDAVEVKRMYTKTDYRKKGFASEILKALEKWAKELGYSKCILETGKRQVEAVKFYKKMNYKEINRYGQYVEMENSVCFEKVLG